MQFTGFTHAFTVVPADGADQAVLFVPKGLYVGGAGDVKVTTALGDTVVFKAVPVGTFIPVKVNRVWATGTTATFIVLVGD